MTEHKRPSVVAVTGAAGYLGRRLLARLSSEESISRIVATDLRPLPEQYPKVVFLQQDIAEPLVTAFRSHGVETVVHLAFLLRQARDRNTSRRVNVDGADALLQACAAASVQRIVLMSSTTVYGAHSDNPESVTEAAPLRPPHAFHYAWDKAQTEHLFQNYARNHPDTHVSILRGCVVMGPSAQNFITSAMFKPLLIGVRGFDPSMQFVHEDDVIELLWRFVSEPHPGVYNVAAPGAVHWSELARMARRRMIWLPAALAYLLTQLTWRLHIQSDSPAVGLDWIRHPWVVSTEKLEKELSYRFQHTAEEALRSFLEASA